MRWIKRATCKFDFRGSHKVAVRRGTGCAQRPVTNVRSTPLTFEPFEITDQIPDLTGIQPELGHIRMPGDNTFTERFFK